MCEVGYTSFLPDLAALFSFVPTQAEARQRQAVLQSLAGGGQLGADAAGDQLPAMDFDQFGNLLQDAVDRGKVSFFVHGFHPDRAERLIKWS